MRISDWSSDVCSSDLPVNRRVLRSAAITGRKPAKAKESFSHPKPKQLSKTTGSANRQSRSFFVSPHRRASKIMGYRIVVAGETGNRSEEHTSELHSLMRRSYAAICLKKKQIATKHLHKS